MDKFELLAPAGDIESFETAIANGANAVYLGLGSFNARIKAQNFNAENLEKCVKKAHFFGVKVYITLNTLVRDDEFEAMFDTVKIAVRAKVDAFIVQDLGVCYALKKAFPNIVLHASTQMGIHNLYGAKIAESLGLSRIVLSRETKLADIKAIKENTNLELEYFVQGALCVAFSGNCYLSSVNFGDSGNRGVCRQPCRMCYQAEYQNKTENGYFLSARDLCLIDNLSELIEAGVSSFKIEGRLRRAGYVAETVDCYRKALDNLKKIFDAQNSEESNKYSQNFVRNKSQNFVQNDLCNLQNNNDYRNAPQNSFQDKTQINIQNKTQDFAKSNKEYIKRMFRVFNRGQYLYNGYLESGVPDNVINKNSQNHQGIEIGKIIDVKPFKDIFAITIYSNHNIVVGDGLKFFENGQEVGSLGVGSVKEIARDTYLVYSKAKTKIGQKVNLILDKDAETKALMRNRTVEIELYVVALVGNKLQIKAKFDDVEVCSTSDFVCEKAIKKATEKTEIINQVEKTAESGFKVINVEVETDGVFLPKSILNGLRRECLELLESKIIQNNEKDIKTEINEIEILSLSEEIEKAKIAKSSFEMDNNKVKNNLTFVYSDANMKIESGNTVVICPSDYSTKEVDKLIQNLKSQNNKCELALNLPIIANGEDIQVIENTLKLLSGKGVVIDYLVSNNHYGLYFEKLGYKIIAGFAHNVYNYFATKCLALLNVSKIVKSIELDKNLSSVLPICETFNFELPLMTFAHCPFKTINENKCKNCSYNKNLTYANGKYKYKIRRVKISQCYFELIKI